MKRKRKSQRNLKKDLFKDPPSRKRWLRWLFILPPLLVIVLTTHFPSAQTQYLNSQYTYTYDSVGNRTSMTSPQGTETYTYNPLYELTGVTGAQTHSYTYDPVGNRLMADGIPYTPNPLNQYNSVGGTPFTYDSNGNLTSDGTFAYTYDYENRLKTVTGPGLNVTYTYDPFGRRVKKEVNGIVTYFIYDGDQVIEERGSGGVLKATYTYGTGIDEVLTMKRNQDTFYYFYDGLGSIRDLTTAQGELVESYTYDPYGIPNQPSAVGNPFFFTGRQLDPETGLYNYRNRQYHPGIGRFMQREPEPEDFNVYRYVSNNPVTWVDPVGNNLFNPNLYSPYPQVVIPTPAPVPQPLPPTEWTPPIHQPPGPDVIPGPAPGTEAGNKGRSGKEVGIQGDGGVQGSGASLAQAGGATQGKGGRGKKGEIEKTPTTHPEDFEPVRGRPGKKNKKTGEIFDKDRFHRDHYEVYKNLKDYEKGRRSHSVWPDGRVKESF